MKKKTVFLVSVFIGLVAINFVACHPETEMQTENDVSRMTYEEEIAVAREFYESLRPLKTRAAMEFDEKTERGIIANMEPLWGKNYSYRRKTKKTRTVEAVMTGTKYSTFMLSEVREKYKATKDARYKQSMTRLVVETDIETGKVQAFTMTIVPSLRYLEQTNFKPFFNTYVKRDKHFDGWILFHEIDGRFANGWQYSDGKITHTISKADISVEDYNLLKAQTRGAYQICEMVDDWVLIEECMEWHTVTEYQHSIEEGDCTIYWEYQGLKEVCRWVSDDPPSSGGGGTSGGYRPDPTLPSVLQSLFKENKIGADAEILAQVYEDIFENCLYAQIRDYISESGIIFNAIRYKDIPGEASVSTLGNLSFRDRDCIEYSIFAHEYFHMFQCAVAGNFSVASLENKTALEFEQHMFEDIAAAIEFGPDFIDNMARTWACSYSMDSVLMLYKKWIFSLTDGGSKFPTDISVSEYRKFLNHYWEDNRSNARKSGYECEASNYEPTALKLVYSAATKNCESIY